MIYRAVKMTGIVYVIKIESREDFKEDTGNILQFADEGNPVIIADELEYIADLFDVEEEDIILVEIQV